MSADTYIPGQDDQWERRRPEQAGLDPDRLAQAVAFHESHETHLDRDLYRALDELTAGEGVHAKIVGPTKPRGGPAWSCDTATLSPSGATRRGWT